MRGTHENGRWGKRGDVASFDYAITDGGRGQKGVGGQGRDLEQATVGGGTVGQKSLDAVDVKVRIPIQHHTYPHKPPICPLPVLR